MSDFKELWVTGMRAIVKVALIIGVAALGAVGINKLPDQFLAASIAIAALVFIPVLVGMLIEPWQTGAPLEDDELSDLDWTQW